MRHFTTDVRPTGVQLSQRSWGEQQEGNKVSRLVRPVNVKMLVAHVPSNMFAREACNFCLDIQYRSKTTKMYFFSIVMIIYTSGPEKKKKIMVALF